MQHICLTKKGMGRFYVRNKVLKTDWRRKTNCFFRPRGLRPQAPVKEAHRRHMLHAGQRPESEKERMADKKKPQQRKGFRTNEYIVYPSHGVGRILSIEEEEIAGATLELFVITFEKDKMTLRVPTSKTETVGMRKLSEDKVVKKAMTTLKGRARVKRTMWSRRAQEYEAKINSGDLISIAEVVRDLYRSDSQPEQSYSERQLYEAALGRMAREVAVVEKLDEEGAFAKISEVLTKSSHAAREAAANAALAAEEAAGAGDATEAAA